MNNNNPFDDIRTFEEWWRAMVASDASATDPQTESFDFEIMEVGDELILTSDLPRAKEEELVIEVAPHRLVIKGRYHKSEDVFKHDIQLPKAVMTYASKAIYKNGVLEVVMPLCREHDL